MDGSETVSKPEKATKYSKARTESWRPHGRQRDGPKI
jgi:hypothetical protein